MNQIKYFQAIFLVKKKPYTENIVKIKFKRSKLWGEEREEEISKSDLNNGKMN